jgi:hypothetical protein
VPQRVRQSSVSTLASTTLAMKLVATTNVPIWVCWMFCWYCAISLCRDCVSLYGQRLIVASSPTNPVHHRLGIRSLHSGSPGRSGSGRSRSQCGFKLHGPSWRHGHGRRHGWWHGHGRRHGRRHDGRRARHSNVGSQRSGASPHFARCDLILCRQDCVSVIDERWLVTAGCSAHRWVS